MPPTRNLRIRRLHNSQSEPRRPTIPCSFPGCKRSFFNNSGLTHHLRRTHHRTPSAAPISSPRAVPLSPRNAPSNPNNVPTSPSAAPPLSPGQRTSSACSDTSEISPPHSPNIVPPSSPLAENMNVPLSPLNVSSSPSTTPPLAPGQRTSSACSNASELSPPRSPNIAPPSPSAENMDVDMDPYFFNDNGSVDQHPQADPPSPSSTNASHENPELSMKMQHPIINGKLESCD
jgi:hypothetical protein